MFEGRGWRDIAYSTIPREMKAVRVVWHAHRLQQEAKDKKLQLGSIAAEAHAQRLVEEEDSGAGTLALQPPELRS